jgi:plasmid stability protein
MPTMIQVRNVPEPLHRKLKAEAALAGLTLSDFVLDLLQREAERRSNAALFADLLREPVASIAVSGADLVEAERAGR